MSSPNSSEILAGLSNLCLGENLQSNITLKNTRFVLTQLKDSSVCQGTVLFFISFKRRSEQNSQAKYERSANSCLRGVFSPLLPYTLTQTKTEKGLFLFSSISNWSRWQSCTFSDSLLPPLQRDKLFTLDTSFRYREVRSLAEVSLLICISQWSIRETERKQKALE